MKKYLSKLTVKGFKPLIGVVVLIVLLLIVVLSITNPMNDNLLANSNNYNKTTGWTLSFNQQEKTISLPYKENIPTGLVYQIKTVLDDLPSDGNHMLLRSSMQDFTVYLDNQVIYTHIKPKNGLLNDVDASLWVLVDLPEGALNKELRIDISSNISNFSGVVNEVRFGHESSLLFEVLDNSMLSIISAIMLFVSGLLIVGLSLFIKLKQDDRLMNLGFIFITSSIWILSEGRVIQFITGNRWIVGVISYAMIPLMSIAILLYFHDAVFTTSNNKRKMQVFSWMSVLLLIALLGLQIFFNVAFINTMRWGMIYIIVVVLLTSYSLIDEIRKQDNENAVRHIKYIGVLFASIMMEVIVFYLELYYFTSLFILIGSFVFPTLLVYDTFIHFKENYLLEKENELLEEMVYVDPLTQGKNRTAYERDLSIMMNKSDNPFRLVIFDLNDLKFINDNFGHQSGDLALQSMFLAIQESFKEVGECYRLGGDEMVVLMQSTDPHVFHQCIDRLGKYLDEYKYEFKLKVAVGSDVFDIDKHHNFQVFYHQVDKKMYIDKKKLKITTV